jgi:acyl-CoA thioesterase
MPRSGQPLLLPASLSMTDHYFDHALQLEPQEEGHYLGHTSEHYWNMISPFGGTTIATALQAILQHPQRLGDPLAMTVNFAGPIQKGALTVHVTPARTGRSTQHWQIEIRQGGDAAPLLTGTAVFAVRRETWSDTESRLPDVPGPEKLERQARAAHIPFLERYEMRYVDSHPLSGGEDSATQCWINDVPPRPLDFCSIAAFCDTFVPRLFVRKGAPRPISTVTLSINFHVDGQTLQREQSLHAFGKSKANVFRNGYYDQEALLWSRQGTLLATTHQMVWFKE